MTPTKFASLTSVIVLLLTFCPAKANTILFDTMPDNTYFQNGGGPVSSGPPLNPPLKVETAVQFKLWESGTLTKVELALTYAQTPQSFPPIGPVNVYLYTDLGGLFPNDPSKMLLGSVTPTAVFGNTINSIVGFNTAPVALAMGTFYWLGLETTVDPTYDIWNLNDDGFVGHFATSGDDGPWDGLQGILPAFRLTIVNQNNDNGVPESGKTFVLLAMAVSGLLGLRRMVRPRASLRGR